MRYLNLQQSVLVSFLATGVATWAACSSGSDPATSGPAAATSSGAGGSGTSSSAGTGGSGTTATGTTATGSTSSTSTGAGGAAATTTTGSGGSTTTTTGSGGSGGSAPMGPSVCDGKGTRILGLGDGVIDAFRGTTVSGAWSPFNNVAPAMPDNSVKPSLDMASGGGMPASPPSLHYTGMGAKPPTMGGFGVGLLYNLAIDTANKIYCVDISAFDGVSFWAKGTAGAKIGVNFVTPQTNPKETDPLIGGGDCVLMLPGSTAQNPVCYNHPQKLITLTDGWQHYSVTFAEAVGGTSRVNNVLQLFGFLSADVNWNFWVDEIQFYKGTAPMTPIPVGDAGP